MRKVYYWPSAGKKRFHHQLGVCAQLISENKNYKKIPIALLTTWVMPALRARQVGFFFNEFNVPVGYIIWAMLSDDKGIELAMRQTRILLEHEWNCGKKLWIMDLVTVRPWIRPILQYAANDMFRRYEYAYYVKRYPTGAAKNIVSWARTADGRLRIRVNQITKSSSVLPGFAWDSW